MDMEQKWEAWLYTETSRKRSAPAANMCSRTALNPLRFFPLQDSLPMSQACMERLQSRQSIEQKSRLQPGNGSCACRSQSVDRKTHSPRPFSQNPKDKFCWTKSMNFEAVGDLPHGLRQL